MAFVSLRSQTSRFSNLESNPTNQGEKMNNPKENEPRSHHTHPPTHTLMLKQISKMGELFVSKKNVGQNSQIASLTHQICKNLKLPQHILQARLWGNGHNTVLVGVEGKGPTSIKITHSRTLSPHSPTLWIYPTDKWYLYWSQVCLQPQRLETTQGLPWRDWLNTQWPCYLGKQCPLPGGQEQGHSDSSHGQHRP